MPTKKPKITVLPVEFDLDEHIKQYPTFPTPLETLNGDLYYLIKKFKKEKAYHFLGLISSIAARNKDIVTKEGYVPINQGRIRNNIKNIKDYINYLIFTGVIECDDYYIRDEKSMGYRWSKRYSLSKFHAKLVECSYDDYNAEQYAWQFERYPYLFNWYQQGKLMIDDTAAYNAAYDIYI